jgi:hypothetical protein
MLYTHPLIAARAAVGLAALMLASACSEGPAAPRTATTVAKDPVADLPAAVQFLSLSTRVVAAGAGPAASEFTTTTRHGIVALDAWRIGGAANAEPVALRVWDAGGRAPESVRRSARLLMHLPDGRTAIINRETTRDGAPSVLSVQIGGDEFRWQRTWEPRNGRLALRSSVVETVHGGRVVSRSTVALGPREISMAPVARRGMIATSVLLKMTARFGSIAAMLLLPRMAQAQFNSGYGMACNSAATSLRNAWVLWRLAVVTWSINMAIGNWMTITATSTALAAASAGVDNAEAGYIDCYVGAAAAGVPDKFIVDPQIEDYI